LRYKSGSERSYRLTLWAFWIAVGVLAMVNAANSVSSADLRTSESAWAPVLLEFKAWTSRWFVVILVPLVPLLARQVRLFLGDPWLRLAIHNALDQMQRIAFEDLDDSEQPHHHRVTLFKAVEPPWWKLWGRRHLIPVVRSGHATQQCDVKFEIPDSADGAEGIAGLTWAQNSLVPPQALPSIADESDEKILAEFAARTNVSLKWVKEKKPRARSYCGLPVSVDGNLWGVLVFDSRTPDIMDVDKVKTALDAFAKTLSPLLKRF
jgi:hypothetical protein